MNIEVKAEGLRSDDKLPEGWANCMLDDLLITIQSGSRPKGGVKGITDGIPSLGGEHLTYSGGFNFSSIRYVPESFANKMTRGNIQEEDILIVKDGATTGKTAYVDKTFPFKKAVINEHIFICRASKLIDSKCLFYYLISKQGQDQILSNFQGSAQGGINLSFAPNTEVILPPLNEQKRIVAKLEKLLAKVNESCDRLSRIPSILKRFRQSVLASACSGRLTADWRKSHPNIEPAEELLKRIQEERNKDNNKKVRNKSNLNETLSFEEYELYDLPEKWLWVSFEQIATIASNLVPPQEYLDYPHIAPDNIEKGSGILLPFNTIREDQVISPKHLFYSGQILYSKIRPYLSKCVLIDFNGLCSADMYPINTEIDSHYLFRYILSDSFLTFIDKSSGTRTLLPKTNQKQLYSTPVPLPPLEEQKEIVRRVEALFRKCDLIEQRYLNAKTYTDKLTQSILAKAFRGELVPQDSNDEPAEVLLERIREEKTLTEKSSKSKKASKRKTT